MLVSPRHSQGDQLQLDGPIGLIGIDIAIGRFRSKRNFEGVIAVGKETEMCRFFVEGIIEDVRNLSILYLLHYYYKFNFCSNTQITFKNESIIDYLVFVAD